MEIKTRTYNVYKYDELEEEVKDEILNKEIENEFEIFCDFELENMMQEKAIELLKKYFKDNAKFENVYYDLSYSQGSGCMIEFDLKYYGLDIEIKHYGHYNHERSFEIHENYYNEFCLSDKRYNTLEEKIIEMNKELKNYGYEIIENREYFKENALERIKEYVYLQDGSIFE